MKQLILTLAVALFGYSSYAQWNTSSGSIYYNGYVGIGTIPSEVLTIRDTSIAYNASSGIFKLRFDSGGGGGAIGFEKESFNTGGLRFYTQYGYNTTVEQMRITSTGNIGIGTTSPSYKFQVNTGTNQNIQVRPYTFGSSGIFINAANDANTISIPLEFGASSFSFNIGNVGIGTTSPNTPLHIYAGTANSMTTALRLQGGQGGTSSGSSLLFSSSYGAADYQTGKIGAITTGWGTDFKSALAFYTNAGSDGITSLTEKMRIDNAGNMAIGTTDPHGYKLAVDGSAIATSMTVKLYADWPDYVFKPKYHLPLLTTVKAYIDKNQHLPDMPSEQEVKDNGINLGEIVNVQTKKIEELTLYAIDQQKRIDQLEKQQTKNEQQEQRIAALEAALTKLTNNAGK